MHSNVTLKMYGSEKRALLLMISTFCRCTIDIVDRVEARRTAARRVAWRPRGCNLPLAAMVCAKCEKTLSKTAVADPYVRV